MPVKLHHIYTEYKYPCPIFNEQLKIYLKGVLLYSVWEHWTLLCQTPNSKLSLLKGLKFGQDVCKEKPRTKLLQHQFDFSCHRFWHIWFWRFDLGRSSSKKLPWLLITVSYQQFSLSLIQVFPSKNAVLKSPVNLLWKITIKAMPLLNIFPWTLPCKWLKQGLTHVFSSI